MDIVTANQIKSSKIGLNNIHIAEYDPATLQWTAPVRIKTVKSITIAENRTEGKEFNDDSLFEIFNSFEGFTVDLTFTDLTPEEQAFFYGWSSIGAARLSGSDDNPPWIALMGERIKANGVKRLFKYFKGKCRPGNESANSKGDGAPQAQSDTLNIVFAPLDSDFPVPAFANKAKEVIDENDPAWFFLLHLFNNNKAFWEFIASLFNTDVAGLEQIGLLDDIPSAIKEMAEDEAYASFFTLLLRVTNTLKQTK